MKKFLIITKTNIIRNIIVLLVFYFVFPTYILAKQKLSFKNGKFKICQFTDLHWNPESPKCLETTKIIQTVLKKERPSLVILTGDVVTYAPAIKGWLSIIKIFEEAKIPYVVTMGNHDSEIITKDSIFNLLLASPYYIGGRGPKNIFGYGNYCIPVYGSKKVNEIKAVLYCIDSNDYLPGNTYVYYDWIHFNQIEWYREQSKFYKKMNNGVPIPSLAFFHIPLVEYGEIIGNVDTYGNMLEDGVSSSKINSGLFASFLDMKDVIGVFAGHDHNNDIIGIDKGIALAYGRVTGSDAYGSLQRGGRIIELYEGKKKFDTWITTSIGKEDTYYYPSGLTSLDEKKMNYLPAIKPIQQNHGVLYSYYEGKCKNTSEIKKCKKIKEGILKNISIKGALKENHFAYEFRTLIRIPQKGIYQFYTFSDDGSVIYINDKLVVNNDGGHSSREAVGKVALDKGFHEMRVLYFEDYMGQELKIGYWGRNILKTYLPDSILYIPSSEIYK